MTSQNRPATDRDRPVGTPESEAIRQLRASLDALAREESHLEAPARVEDALMRAWNATHGRRAQRASTGVRWVAAGAMAAGLLLTAVTRWGLESPATPPQTTALDHSGDVRLAAAPVPVERPSALRPEAAAPGRASRRTVGASRPAPQRQRTQTVVLVGSPIVPGEPIRVVRMRVARAALLQMGLRPVAAGDADRIEVDMLVGEDGVARGLRLRM